MKHRRAPRWRPSWTAMTALLLLAPALWMSGCTAVGYGIGSIVDAQTPRYTEMESSERLALTPGTHVAVARSDSPELDNVWFVGSVEATGDTVWAMPATAHNSAELRMLFEHRAYERSTRNRRTYTADTLAVRASEVAAMYKPNARNGRTIGALTGLAIDIAVITYAAITGPIFGPPAW